MIPLDIRLYTWVDVEEVLLRIQEQSGLPQWLTWVQAYWDSLTIGICPGTQAEAKDWLSEVYDPRFRIDSQQDMANGLILLESLLKVERTLPVILEETEEKPPVPKLIPSLARSGILVPHGQYHRLPPSFASDLPPLVAFHSFKGGVGRTTHALAFTQALTKEGYRVLLVDGDMEAPGISWLFEKRLPSPPVSFADLLALAHGDPSPEANNTVQLVADRLQSALIDDIFVLPSFRSTERFSSL
ncbi:MAG: AAA family ATPase [Desmonostoc vinosum HA7617-LM4]|jgi:hypothetical protein|nr:AAA family ATPase [Desmonostoc vinosum HA7617-LM4]